MPSPADIAEQLAELFTHATNEDGDAWCIEASRIGVTTLAKLGVASKACAAEVVATNAAAYPLIVAGVPVPEWPPEAWSVGVELAGLVAADSHTEPYRRQGWSGHVIILADTFLLDPTAGQFNRPAKDLIVGKVLFGRRPPGGALELEVPLDKGGRLAYRLHPEVARFRTSNAWQNADLRVAELFAIELRNRLGVTL